MRNQEGCELWTLPEYFLEKLSISQLEDLGKADPSTNTDFEFRKVQFIKKYDVDRNDPRKNCKSSQSARIREYRDN